MVVVLEGLPGGGVEDATAGEAEGEFLIGEREEMELVVEVDLVTVDVRWLSLENGRWLLEEDRLSMLLVRDVLMDVTVKRLTRRDVEGAMQDGLLIGDR